MKVRSHADAWLGGNTDLRLAIIPYVGTEDLRGERPLLIVLDSPYISATTGHRRRAIAGLRQLSGEIVGRG